MDGDGRRCTCAEVVARLRAIVVGRLGARGGVRGANGVDRVPPCVAVYGDGKEKKLFVLRLGPGPIPPNL